MAYSYTSVCEQICITALMLLNVPWLTVVGVVRAVACFRFFFFCRFLFQQFKQILQPFCNALHFQ